MNSSLKLFFPTEEKKNLCAPPNPKLYIALNLICWRWTERNAPIRTDIEQKASSSEAGTPMQDKESCIKYFLEKRHLKKLVQLSTYTVYSKVGFWSTLVYVWVAEETGIEIVLIAWGDTQRFPYKLVTDLIPLSFPFFMI